MNLPDSATAKRPDAHMTVAVLSITLASLALCLCLSAFGVIGSLNEQMLRWMSNAWTGDDLRPLPTEWIWAASATSAFAISSALLHTPGGWRRSTLWIACLAVSFAWAPVLVLAAYQPQIATLLVAVLASGAGSVFYASRHQMPPHETD